MTMKAFGITDVGLQRRENQDTFAVIGASVAENFGVKMPEDTIGTSILNQLK